MPVANPPISLRVVYFGAYFSLELPRLRKERVLYPGKNLDEMSSRDDLLRLPEATTTIIYR